MQSRDGGKLDFSSHPSVPTRFSHSVHPLIFPLLHLLHFPASPGVRYAAAAISSVLPLLFRSRMLVAAMHVVFTSAGGKLLYWQAGLWAFVKVVQGVFAAHIAVMKLPTAFPTEQFAPPRMIQPPLRQKFPVKSPARSHLPRAQCAHRLGFYFALVRVHVLSSINMP